MVYDDSVADTEVFDFYSGVLNNSSHFMSENWRRDVFSVNFLEISATDSTCSHFHEYLVWTNLRRRKILNLNRPFLFDYYGLHLSTRLNIFEFRAVSYQVRASIRVPRKPFIVSTEACSCNSRSSTSFKGCLRKIGMMVRLGSWCSW